MASDHLSMRPAVRRLGLAACVTAGIIGAAGALADTDAVPGVIAAPAPEPVAINEPVQQQRAPASPRSCRRRQELEQRHATVGAVVIDVDDIFDEDDPRENKLLYRWANDLHIRTRDSTVREQLLFKPGEPLLRPEGGGDGAHPAPARLPFGAPRSSRRL